MRAAGTISRGEEQAAGHGRHKMAIAEEQFLSGFPGKTLACINLCTWEPRRGERRGFLLPLASSFLPQMAKDGGEAGWPKVAQRLLGARCPPPPIPGRKFCCLSLYFQDFYFYFYISIFFLTTPGRNAVPCCRAGRATPPCHKPGLSTCVSARGKQSPAGGDFLLEEASSSVFLGWVLACRKTLQPGKG